MTQRQPGYPLIFATGSLFVYYKQLGGLLLVMRLQNILSPFLQHLLCQEGLSESGLSEKVRLAFVITRHQLIPPSSLTQIQLRRIYYYSTCTLLYFGNFYFIGRSKEKPEIRQVGLSLTLICCDTVCS